jgi:hypothetical protein
LRHSTEDAEVTDLLRQYDRIVVRLSELCVDVSDRNPTGIQVRSHWKNNDTGQRVEVRRVWFVSYLTANGREAHGWTVKFADLEAVSPMLTADADWFRDYHTEVFD